MSDIINSDEDVSMKKREELLRDAIIIEGISYRDLRELFKF